MWIFTTLLALLSLQGTPEPAFRFGIVADVQYADKDTAGKRHYRTSLERLKRCVGELNRHDLAFVVQLGDLIDEPGEENLARVLAAWEPLKSPLRHVLGNHEFAAPGERGDVLRRLGLTSGDYDFRVGSWRFVVLDSVDVSLSGGWPEGHPNRQQASDWLATLKESGNKNAQSWNGGLSERQTLWLEGVLSSARERDERVVVFSHLPLLEAASSEWHLLWNHAEVVRRLESSGVVAAVFCGHDHAGGYAERDGIHHVTVNGMVEAPEKNAWGIVEVHADRLELKGFGSQPSRTLPLRK
ncbi:MAG: metallophosphoesterase [Planctomycetota bacterium]